MVVSHRAVCLLAALFFAAITVSLSLDDESHTDGDWSYNNKAARNGILHSAASYCPQALLEPWNCLACKEISQIRSAIVAAKTVDGCLTQDDAFAYATYDPSTNELVASFRGSVPTSMGNWLSNFNAGLTDFDMHDIDGNLVEDVPVDEAKVHEGFYSVYNMVAKDLISAAKWLLDTVAFDKTTVKVFLTGHSRGGAIATIAAAQFLKRGYKNIELVTFGSPRVFTKPLSNWLESRITATRIVHYRDVVTWVPPSNFKNYRHVGKEIHFNRKYTEYKICANEEDNRCSGSLSSWQPSVSDHVVYDNVYVGHHCTPDDLKKYPTKNGAPHKEEHTLTEEEEDMLERMSHFDIMGTQGVAPADAARVPADHVWEEEPETEDIDPDLRAALAKLGKDFN